jgi:hypothetical protein
VVSERRILLPHDANCKGKRWQPFFDLGNKKGQQALAFFICGADA